MASRLPQSADERAFEEALEEIVAEAQARGVDVRGGWVCRPNGDRTAVDVSIVEVASDAATTD